jgi:ubiquinone/menaquinone biosynthesis C-methylase UbiE
VVRGATVAQALPIRSGAVTGYAMGGSLNEIGDIRGMLAETRRVLRDDGRFVSMHLVRAESRRGRMLQRLLSTGGIVFPRPAELADTFGAAGLRTVAAWRWRVVTIAMLLPAARTAQ